MAEAMGLPAQRVDISDLPNELIERIAAIILTDDSVGARDIFAFSEVSRRWRHVAISLARLVADGVPDLTDLPWEKSDAFIGTDELHTASSQSELLLDLAGIDGLRQSDRHFYCDILGNLLQHPPLFPRPINSGTLKEYTWKHCESTDFMVAEVIGQQVTLVDWRNYPPRLLPVQLTRPPQKRERWGGYELSMDVLRKPGSTEVVAILFQTKQDLDCVPLNGASRKQSICLAYDEDFTTLSDGRQKEWIPAKYDHAASATLRWTRVKAQAKDRYCLELLTMRRQESCWQPTYSGMIAIDTFPVGSQQCISEAVVKQDYIYLISWACVTEKATKENEDDFTNVSTEEMDVDWIGLSTVPYDAITSGIARCSEAAGIQTFSLHGRRRCGPFQRSQKFEGFLYVSQDCCHILSMTTENTIEVHSRRSANCDFDSKPSHTIAARSSRSIQLVGMSENFAIYTEKKEQTLDIVIFNYRVSDRKAQTIEDILKLPSYNDYFLAPRVWISDTIVVAIQGRTPVAILLRASHHWMRSDGAKEMAAALGWSCTIATEIHLADAWIKSDQLILVIVSELDVVALALCRQDRPPSILDLRPAGISCAPPEPEEFDNMFIPGNDDGPTYADEARAMGVSGRVWCQLERWPSVLSEPDPPRDDGIILLDTRMPVLLRTEDACCRWIPRIRVDQGPRHYDPSASVFLQYPQPKDSEEPDDDRQLDIWGPAHLPRLLLRFSNDRAAPMLQSLIRTGTDKTSSKPPPGMKLSHVAIPERLLSSENQPHRDLIRTAVSNLAYGDPDKRWTLLRDGSAIWVGDVVRFLALAQAKVPGVAIRA